VQMAEVVRRRLAGDGDPARQAEPTRSDRPSPDQQGDAQWVPPRRTGSGR
jgi:hypothetical protein